MTYRHECPLCEWAREAEHSTVLDPSCPHCGGVLELHAAHEPDPALEAFAALPLAQLRASRAMDRLLTTAVALPLVLAAGKIGWTQAGPTIGVVALMVAALAAYVAIAPATRQR